MGGGSGSRASSSGRAKVGSVEDVVARITGADDRGLRGRRRGGSELLLGSGLGAG